MKLYIKNMVCNRCKTIVRTELNKLGIQYITVELGEVITNNKITPVQRTQLYNALQQSGFELIEEKKNDLIEKLKRAVVDLENYSDEDLKTSYADYISLKVNDNFITLNTLFAEIEGITIEKYIIKYKIERVKELLVYEDLDIEKIALKMHYSSAAQLSSQFKSLTGLTPLHFRQLRHTRVSIPETIKTLPTNKHPL
ncbi:MAG: helix-turn-helix transcriptional regulator [Bacteroidales bacterium]|nr:helix-turn-helix transcriptional regulator [Bacteroidales bacterium]